TSDEGAGGEHRDLHRHNQHGRLGESPRHLPGRRLGRRHDHPRSVARRCCRCGRRARQLFPTLDDRRPRRDLAGLVDLTMRLDPNSLAYRTPGPWGAGTGAGMAAGAIDANIRALAQAIIALENPDLSGIPTIAAITMNGTQLT